MNAVSTNTFLEQLEARQADLKQFGVARVGLFGSCLRGEQRADSDVDVLVNFAPGHKSLANLIDLAEYLEALFHRRVELVTPESLSPYIGPHILREVQYAQIAA
jgi:hypothetical protein